MARILIRTLGELNRVIAKTGGGYVHSMLTQPGCSAAMNEALEARATTNAGFAGVPFVFFGKIKSVNGIIEFRKNQYRSNQMIFVPSGSKAAGKMVPHSAMEYVMMENCPPDADQYAICFDNDFFKPASELPPAEEKRTMSPPGMVAAFKAIMGVRGK